MAPTFVVCPTNQSLETKPGLPTALFEWRGPTAADNSGSMPLVTCSPESGSEFLIGHSKVTCVAVDGSSNNSTCIFQIDVQGMFMI